jgi:predicted PurR-regulated permease PerM
MMNSKSLQSHDIARTTLQVLFIGMLIASVVWILLPFLTPIIWATMIVVATWPILIALQTRMKGIRGLAVATMTIILLLVVLMPFLAAIIAIMKKAADVSTWVKSLMAFTVPPPPAWLEGVPLAGPRLSEYWRQFQSLGPSIWLPMLNR